MYCASDIPNKLYIFTYFDKKHIWHQLGQAAINVLQCHDIEQLSWTMNFLMKTILLELVSHWKESSKHSYIVLWLKCISYDNRWINLVSLGGMAPGQSGAVHCVVWAGGGSALCGLRGGGGGRMWTITATVLSRVPRPKPPGIIWETNYWWCSNGPGTTSNNCSLLTQSVITQTNPKAMEVTKVVFKIQY